MLGIQVKLMRAVIREETTIHTDYSHPVSTHKETKRAVKILDAKYEKADLPAAEEENCTHLTDVERPFY